MIIIFCIQSKDYYSKGYSPGAARKRYPSIRRSRTGSQVIPLSLGVTPDALFSLPVNFRDTWEMYWLEPKETGLSLGVHSSQRAGHIGSTYLLCDQPWCRPVTDTRCTSGVDLHVYFKYAIILVYLGPRLRVYKMASLPNNYVNALIHILICLT